MLAVGTGCSGHKTPEQTVAGAVESFDNRDFESAQHAIDQLMADSAAFSSLSASQLCVLAELCLRVDSARRSEPAVADPGEAVAARCLTRARALSADTVSEFINSLPRERASRLSTIDLVGTFLDTPRDSLVVEDEATDSI